MYGKSHTTTQSAGKLILWASLATTLALMQLPYQKVDGKLLPTIIFNKQPSLFHAFILSLNFSIFGSFIEIILREEYPRVARSCLLLALVSMTVGIAILAVAYIVPVPF
ncbi:hypothetical protein L484_026518 [Morus notabilis]|uniref:PGG domain-containing protein n=1 Tax=Morus notabilis TaxID=981085 RepID=W9QNU5_9ROSA|nr:hypothetical protein L484_026518 [Morus notabilis]